MSGVSGVGVFWAVFSLLGSLGAVFGFYMPYWITGEMSLHVFGQSGDNIPVQFGVFRRCNYPAVNSGGQLTMIMECGRYTTFSDIPSISWKIATLTIGVGCGLSLLVGVVASFGLCVQGVIIPTVARTAGILQICSGLLMGTGVGVYPNGWDSTEVRQACGNLSKSYSLGDCSLSWCFHLTSVGIAVTLVCSVLAFHAPKRKQIITGYAL